MAKTLSTFASVGVILNHSERLGALWLLVETVPKARLINPTPPRPTPYLIFYTPPNYRNMDVRQMGNSDVPKRA